MMDIIPANGMLSEFKGDAVALGVFENPEKGKPPALPQSAQRLDAKEGGIISASVKAGEFTGKQNSVMLYHAKGIPSRAILLVGLGKKTEFEADIVRQAAGKACCAARDLGAKKLAFCVESVAFKEVRQKDAGRLLTEGAILGLYKFQSHKSEAEKKELNELHLFTKGSAKEVAEGAKYGEIAASSANIAREIANSPGNMAPPMKIAAIASELARNYGFKCKILGKKEMMKEKMGGMLSVTAGSHQPPAFVVLEYDGPKSKGKKPVVLIGKGITFDSGGISIKPSKDMDRMKFDKSGACAVIGTFIAAARANVPQRLVGLIPLVENLPGGSAARPGDIVKMRSGKTAEVISTDAEGRMILADALDYSKKYKPRAIIDLATLTGACVIALGYECSGLMGNDDKLASHVEKSGEESGERVWRLPMWKFYNDYNKSEVADIKNVGMPGGAAGTIAAGKFLEAFVPEGVAWAHLDIAGTAWNEKQSPYLALGGTGVGVRLLLALLHKL